MITVRRLPPRQRPDRAHDAGPARRRFNACGAEMKDYVTINPVDPMYRAVYADGSTLFVRHGREAMTQEIREFANAKEAEAFGDFCDWLEKLYRAEMDSFIDANFNSPLDLVKPWKSGLDWSARRLRQARQEGGVVLRRRAPAADLQLPVDVRRPRPLRGARALRRDHLHGLGRGRLRPRGRHAHDGGGARRGGQRGRRRDPVRLAGQPDPARPNGPVTGVEIGPCSERIDADAVVCNPDLPVAYRELLPGVDAPRTARNGKYSPSCLLWVAGVKGLPPAEAAHHNIHFGDDWDGSFKALIDDGVRMPDPSILVTLHSLDDRSLAPEGHSSIYVLEPTPNLSGTIDWSKERDRSSTACAERVEFARLPHRGRRRGDLRPHRLGAHGHGAGHAVRAGPHVLPDRAVPAEQRQQEGARASCSPARRRCPASACRWCWCPASSPPSGSDQYARQLMLDEPLSSSGALTTDADDDTCCRPGRSRSTRATSCAASSTSATAPRTTGRPRCCRRSSSTTSTRCTRSPATPTTSSTRSRRRAGATCPTEVRAAALADFGDRFFADLDAGQVRRPGAEGGRAHGAGVRHRHRGVPPVPAVDDDGPHRRVVRHVGRPARVHGRLGGRDRRDDAADPRADRLRRRAAARPRPRQRVPAHELPARHRRGPRPRPPVRPAGGHRPLRCRPHERRSRPSSSS
jgi:hypothetical protein